MGAHNGLVRVDLNGGRSLLVLNPSATANATPLVSYGTVGVNDSGAVLVEGIAYTKAKFQLVGAGSTAAGYTVAIYGTISPKLLAGSGSAPGQVPYGKLNGNTTLVPATDWDLVGGESLQGGTGTSANPLVSGGTKILDVSGGPYVAYRVVLTVIGSPTANCEVLGMLAP